MTSTETSVMDKTVSRAWWLHGAALALLFIVLLVAFRDDVMAVTEVWWLYPTYSHCFLIVPISLWLIWDRREELSHVPPTADLRALWFAPVFLLMWSAGEIFTINEVHQFAVIGFMQVAIAAILGFRVFRLIWFPALYLFFLVPTGGYLVAPMQQFATSFVDVTLNILGIAHHTEGTLFEFTNGSFEIAEACAGLRFLIATVALGTLFAYMVFRKWYKIVLFLFACIAVPLIGNSLRIVGIMLLAHFTNNAYGVGADHLVYGWGFNVAILLILLLLGSLFRDQIVEPPGVIASAASTDSLRRIVTVFAAAAILTCMGPAVASWNEHRQTTPSLASLTRPISLRGWRSDASAGDWQPSYPGTNAQLLLSFTRNDDPASMPVDLYVGYYARARTAHALTAHINYLWDDKIWTQVETGRASARLNGQAIALQEAIIKSAEGRRMIWSSIWVDGTFTESPVMVKLLQARGTLEGNEGQALIAVSTIVTGTDDQARHSLSVALASLSELPERLKATNSR